MAKGVPSINEGLLIVMFFFSGDEAEYVDILLLGIGVLFPEVCHHGLQKRP